MAISSIGYDHIEQISRAFAAVTIDPLKGAVQYFFPWIGAYFTAHHPLSCDPSLEAAMPLQQTDLMLREIKNLVDCAEIDREVLPYVALNHTFSSCGGTYSITKPIVFIPEQHLFRRQGLSPFPQQRPDENFDENRWIFSDDEVRFFIARELGQISESSSLIKVAIKVAILAAAFTIYASPLGLWSGIILAIGALGLYLFSERVFQARADLIGVEILMRRGVANPVQVAAQALKKQVQQNLYRRENSSFARLFILESGDNLLDFMHPFLTTRIERLKSCEGNF